MSEISTIKLIKFKAKRLKKDNPSESHCNLLDEATKQVTNFKNYQDFINRHKSKKPKENIKNKIQDIISALGINENGFHEIEQVVTNKIGDLLVGKIVHDYSIPDDNNEATIEEYYEPEEIEILINEAFSYGENQFGIPFTLTINVNTRFYVFKSNIYSIEEIEMPSLSDHNKHYFEAEKEYFISVLGLVSVTVEQDNLDLDDLSENISAIDISSIDRIKLLSSDDK